MIKQLLVLLPLLPLATSAQKLATTHPSTTYRVGSEKAFLYGEAADTTKKSRQFLSPGDEAFVVGEFSPHWAVVKRMGGLYLTPTRNLVNYNSVRLAADRVADAVGLPIDPQTHLITYEGVVQVAGVSKNDLYTRAYAWVAQTYRSANDVIQMQDKEAGQLIAKGLIRVTSRTLGMNVDAGVVRHTLTIYVKDGRYKYVLTNLEHEDLRPKAVSIGPLETQNLPFRVTKKSMAELKQRVNRDVYNTVADLQSAMTVQGKKDPSDF